MNLLRRDVCSIGRCAEGKSSPLVSREVLDVRYSEQLPAVVRMETAGQAYILVCPLLHDRAQRLISSHAPFKLALVCPRHHNHYYVRL